MASRKIEVSKKMNKKIAVVAIMAGALLVTGCNQQGKEDAAKTPATQVAAPVADLAVPPADDSRAWKLYLVNVAKRNMDGIRSSPYMYYLPAAGADDFQEQYESQRDNVAGAVYRGVLPGNMLAFGSPESNHMADLIVDAFEGVSPGSMKDVRVLFIGAAEDLDRVKAAIEPTGANVVFHEVK